MRPHDPKLEKKLLKLRDPYVFEFLGIERRGVMAESDLEGALVDHGPKNWPSCPPIT